MTGHCCDRMAWDLARHCARHPDRHDCPDALIAAVRGGIGLIVHDGSRSVIGIGHCPWCAAPLPAIGEIDEAMRPPPPLHPPAPGVIAGRHERDRQQS